MKRAPSLFLLFFCALPGLAREAAPPAPKAAETVEVLPAMKVKGEVQCSFGFGVSLFRQTGTTKLLRIFIARMHPDSPAAKLGLRPGDEILSLNGEKVRGMDSEARQDGQLFSLLCNRRVGDTLEVEVVMQDRVQRLTLKAVQPATREKAPGR